LWPREVFFLFSAHRFFINSDERLLPAAVRRPLFFLAGVGEFAARSRSPRVLDESILTSAAIARLSRPRSLLAGLCTRKAREGERLKKTIWGPRNYGVKLNSCEVFSFAENPTEVTQMVRRGNQCTPHRRSRQGPEAPIPEPNKINARTPYDFEGKNLTAYGGLLAVATMLEKLGFQPLVEELLKVKRVPRVMPFYHFVLGMVLALYVGFSRLNHLR
jgi:hypothetical protein